MADTAPARKILLLLGDRDSSASLASILRNKGLDVFEAHSSPDAIERIQASMPDAVLVDLQLERGWGGFEFINRIRHEHPLVRIVASSATPQWFAANGPHAGIPLVLQPYDLDRLVALLQGKADPGATADFTADDDVVARSSDDMPD